jgi:hypothetical protein
LNLNTTQLEELNRLLKSKTLDLPDFRRDISPSGNNYNWLQRNIGIRNKDLEPRLKELLGIN